MANKPLAPPDYIQRFRLFLAMPVGIIGYEFTCCWQSRDRVLLITKVRKCLEKWGYSAKDVPCLGFRGWVCPHVVFNDWVGRARLWVIA